MRPAAYRRIIAAPCVVYAAITAMSVGIQSYRRDVALLTLRCFATLNMTMIFLGFIVILTIGKNLTEMQCFDAASSRCCAALNMTKSFVELLCVTLVPHRLHELPRIYHQRYPKRQQRDIQRGLAATRAIGQVQDHRAS